MREFLSSQPDLLMCTSLLLAYCKHARMQCTLYMKGAPFKQVVICVHVIAAV